MNYVLFASSVDLVEASHSHPTQGNKWGEVLLSPCFALGITCFEFLSSIYMSHNLSPNFCHDNHPSGKGHGMLDISGYQRSEVAAPFYTLRIP
jgi:hypothetical protein